MAVTCGVMIGLSLNVSDTGEASRAALARGALPLLYAQEEIVRWEAAQNQGIAKLEQEVAALKVSLETAKGEFAAKEQELARLRSQMSTDEQRRRTAIDQAAKLQKIETAFKEADAERQKAEAAQMSSGGISIDYDQWQKEWDELSKDALEKIKLAEDQLADLKNKQPGWEAKRDNLTPDEKTEIKTAYEASEKSMKDATAAIMTAKEQLDTRMKEQAKQLDQAIQEIAKKAPPP